MADPKDHQDDDKETGIAPGDAASFDGASESATAPASEPGENESGEGESVATNLSRARRRFARWRSRLGALKRTSWRMLILRGVVYGATAFAICLLFAYAAIRTFVQPEDIQSFVKQVVEEQTGGRLDIGAVTFDILTGVRLESVQFYAPLAGDTRGFAHGGAVDAVPLANFEALAINYSIPRIFAGRFYIKAMQLIGPEVHLREEDGRWNFDGIIAYRNEKFPSEEPVPASASDTPTSETRLPIFNPAMVYLPFELLAQNIGIKGLRFDLIKMESGKVAQLLVTNGLTFDLGMHWFGRESTLWFTMMNPFENPLEVDVQDGARDEQGKLTGHLSQTLLLRAALNMRFSIDDMQRIGMDFATRVIDLQTPFARYSDVGTYAKMRLKVADNLRKLSVEGFEAIVADAMAYDLSGDISLPGDDLSAIALNLKQKFNLNLQSAATLARPFVPSLKASGSISFDDFKIEGPLDLEKLARFEDGVPLPYTSGVLWLEDVFVEYPELGVNMDPISGDVSLAAGPSLTGTGSQVDLAVDVDIPRFEARQVLPVGEVTAGVEAMTAQVTARLLWPEMIAPVLKINVEAENVHANGSGIAPLVAPFYMSVDGDGHQDLARLGLSANVELTDLMEFSAMADCQIRCAKFRSSILARMDSLERLHSLAMPLGGALGFAEFMPTKMTGTFDFQLAMRGKLPDPWTTPFEQFFEKADLRFNTQMSVAKMNAHVPFFKVDLKGFETRLLANGNLTQQKVDLSQKFESLTLELPPAKDEVTGAPLADAKPVPVSLNRYAFDVAIVNDIDGPLNLKNPLPQLATEIETWLYVGKAHAEGLLPRPVSEIAVESLLKQERLANVTLKHLDVKLPDFGTHVRMGLDTTLGTDFLPTWIKSSLETQIAHSGDERLPGGVKTSGRIDVKVAVESADMRSVTVDGRTSFEDFNLTVPKSGGESGNLLVVEEIQGLIPFKQTFTLPPLQTLLQRPEGGGAQAVAVATASAPEPRDSVPNLAELDTEQIDDAASRKLEKAMTEYLEKTEDKLAGGTNQVALVDYGSIRPFYPDRKPLSIKRLEAANLELSRMEFDLELRQNWFAVNQFVIGFLGGKIQGDFQFAFDAQANAIKDIPRSLKTSVHMTRLDTRKLIERFPNLKGKGSRWDVFANPYLDGTVHLKFDLRTSDLGGGIEITSIGKEQMKMMLYYVDPFEQNPTITDIRKALSFGDVRQVSIPFKNGEIGMDVDVRVVSVPWPTPKLTRFPISQIIQNIKDQALGGSSGNPAQDAPVGTPLDAPQVSG